MLPKEFWRRFKISLLVPLNLVCFLHFEAFITIMHLFSGFEHVKLPEICPCCWNISLNLSLKIENVKDWLAQPVCCIWSFINCIRSQHDPFRSTWWEGWDIDENLFHGSHFVKWRPDMTLWQMATLFSWLLISWAFQKCIVFILSKKFRQNYIVNWTINSELSVWALLSRSGLEEVL